jgi:hypothetical protein
VRGQVFTDLGLERKLSVQAHAATPCASCRTSICPVTAAEISAVRRS